MFSEPDGVLGPADQSGERRLRSMPYVHARLAAIYATLQANVDGSVTFTWLPAGSELSAGEASKVTRRQGRLGATWMRHDPKSLTALAVVGQKRNAGRRERLAVAFRPSVASCNALAMRERSAPGEAAAPAFTQRPSTFAA